MRCGSPTRHPAPQKVVRRHGRRDKLHYLGFVAGGLEPPRPFGIHHCLDEPAADHRLARNPAASARAFARTAAGTASLVQQGTRSSSRARPAMVCSMTASLLRAHACVQRGDYGHSARPRFAGCKVADPALDGGRCIQTLHRPDGPPPPVLNPAR